MAGWHHRCNGHGLGQTLGDGKEKGGLVCYGPWGHKESDMTGQLNDISNSFPDSNVSFCSLLKHLYTIL